MAQKAPRNRRGRILFSILALLFAVGVVPLVFEEGTSWQTVGLTGSELVTIRGLHGDLDRPLLRPRWDGKV